MQLYPFQREQLDEVKAAFADRGVRSVVMQLPTGGGKTVMAGWLAKRLNELSKNVLVLVHRRELIDQFSKTIEGVGLGAELSFIAPGLVHSPWCRFQIGSIMTCVRREIAFQPNFIIIDEAHHCRAKSWSALLNRWDNTHILGLTATPMRMDGKGLGKHFDRIVSGKSMRWLIENEYLSPYEYKVPANHLNMKGVKVSMGDYSRHDAYANVDDEVIADAARAYKHYADGRSALFFGIVREHSIRVAEKLRALGVAAEHVDGDTPTMQRKYAIARFRRKQLKVLCNVDIATEGVDIPGCDVVMLGRPTKSLTIYLQQIGRVLRYQKGKRALILDLVGNMFNENFGMPDEPRVWSLDDDVIKMNLSKMTDKDRPEHVICVKCDEVYSSHKHICPSCGHVRETTPRELPVEAEIEMVTIDGDNYNIPKTKTGYNRKAVIKIAARMVGNREKLEALRLQLGYKKGWVRHIESYINKSRSHYGQRYKRHH